MTYKERLIELLQHSPTDAMGNHGVGAMADHLMDNGLVFKELYEDMEERITHQRVRAQTAEHFICKLCAECDYEDNNGITTMILKCCSMFPECGKFRLRSGWIPVSERLPEDDLPKDSKKKVIKVLVAYQTSMGVWVVRTNTRQKGRWYKNEGWDWAVSDNITHWMPLPEPPGEQK